MKRSKLLITTLTENLFYYHIYIGKLVAVL